MQAVLALYFTSFLGYQKQLATIVVSLFIFAYNAIAPVGGVLSDRLIGE